MSCGGRFVMDIIARTRPGLILKTHQGRPAWARAFVLGEVTSLEITAGVSGRSVYLNYLDATGFKLEERWHASLPELFEAVSREFTLRERDWVFVPGWQSRFAAAAPT